MATVSSQIRFGMAAGLCAMLLVAVSCSGRDNSSPSTSVSATKTGCTGGVVVTDPLIAAPVTGGASSVYFSNAASVPQSKDCDGMRQFLSEPQPGLDLQSYVFYGHLDSSDGAVITFSTLGQTSTIGSGAANTSNVKAITTNTGDGVQLGGFAGGPATVMSGTTNPFSARATNAGDFLDVRVVDGQLGQPGSTLEITSSAESLDAAGKGGTTQVWIRATDRSGVAQWGYGPSGFFPQWLQPNQRTAVTDQHGGNVGDYLKASNDPMTNQGSYYYSSTFIDVEQFSVTRDGAVVASGTGGQLIADFVTQKFDDAAKAIIDNGVEWLEFTSFLTRDKAMKIGQVSQSSVGTLPYAVLVEDTGGRLTNGSLAAAQSWPIDGITITPDKTKTWTSPLSKKTYSTAYTVTLVDKGKTDTLTYTVLFDDQEIDTGGRIVYEGIFKVQGTFGGETIDGYSWGEIQPISGFDTQSTGSG
ncbi:MAG: hypothetical protein WEA11_03415 [Acidimicrobiales bacterium]